MINGLSGRPGSGKSYEAVVTHILPALQQGRKIVTNIPLNIEWFVSVLGEPVKELIVLIDGGFHNYGGTRYFSSAADFLTYQDWRNDKNQGVYFFVDECHLSMGKIIASELTPDEKQSRLSQRKELKEYLSMHRHYGHDLLLLTQNFRKVDPDIKDMVSTCYFTTKLSFLGQDHKYVCKVADGVTRNIVAKHEREYQKKYFSAYKSHTKSEGSVQEAKTADIKPWWQHKFIIWGSLLMLLFIFLVNKTINDLSDGADKRKAAIEKGKNAFSTPVQSSPVLPVQTTLPVSPGQTTPQTTDDPTRKTHPYDGLQLHIMGSSADYDKRGTYQKVIWISVSRNGQMLKEITHADLALAGYTFTVLNDCMIDLSYSDKYQNFLFCDSPTQQVTFSESSTVAKN